jgi:drug/metabolite transporter (DMT)-like permease
MNYKPYLAILTTIILFSTIEVAIKLGGSDIDPYFLAVIRFVVAGSLMVLLKLKELRSISPSHYLLFFLVGSLGLAGTFGPFHSILDPNSQNSILASEAALIFSTNPIFAALFASLILKEKLSIKKIFALLVGFAGVYLVIFGFNSPQFESSTGLLIALWSAFAFGGYTVFNKKLVVKYGALLSTGVVFIIGGISLLPFVHSFQLPQTVSSISLVIYLTFLITFVGYYLYFYGLKRVPIAVGASLFYLKPIIATFLALILLKESINLNFFAGMIVIFIALTISILPEKSRE